MIASRGKLRTRRDLMEDVLRRSIHLDDADRMLLDQVLRRDVPTRELAQLGGPTCRALQYRVRTLIHRLQDVEVIYILKQHRHWSMELRAVALGLWVRGHTQEQTARAMGISLHRLRQHVHTVRGMLQEAGVARPARRDVVSEPDRTPEEAA